jgi:hypothetical protein
LTTGELVEIPQMISGLAAGGAMGRRPPGWLLGFAATTLLAVTAAMVATWLTTDRYTVSIRSGLEAKVGADEAVAHVTTLLRGSQRLRSDSVVPIDVQSAELTTWAGADLEMGSGTRGGTGAAAEDAKAVWLVRAVGPFLAHFGPPGVPRGRSSHGYYVLDANTGSVLEMGFP